MHHPQRYAGLEVVILGLAKSGQAAAKLFKQFGAIVTANDAKPREQCPEADELEAIGVKVICGSHPDDLIHDQIELVVKNPGIPYSSAPVRRAVELSVEIVTEVEVAGLISPGPIIGITGSNGKTTTTTWVGRMLDAAGLQPIVAGNIGRPLCDAALDCEPNQWIVAELSSFQLKGTQQFHPRIACLLNVYETHLDYHGDMQDYIGSKAKLFANQSETDVAVLNWDDAECRRLAESIRANVLPFSRTNPLEYGVYVDEDNVVFRDRDGRMTSIAAVSEIGLSGKHNLENALAAAAIAVAANVPTTVIASQLRDFQGVEHRQEFVREVGGVRYFNDSKATNSAATIKAIDAFSSPIVWIGGGLERGMSYDELIPWFEDKVKAVVLIGETRFKLREAAEQAGVQSVYVVDTADNAQETIGQAVQLAYRAAEPGDIVLFSPACASWDMFASYEERGRMFKASAHNL